MNTDEALLWGYEAYMERDINCCLTVFAASHYVEGEDLVLNLDMGHLDAASRGLLERFAHNVGQLSFTMPNPNRRSSTAYGEGCIVKAGFVSRIGLLPFALYRLVLAAVILYVLA